MPCWSKNAWRSGTLIFSPLKFLQSNSLRLPILLWRTVDYHVILCQLVIVTINPRKHLVWSKWFGDRFSVFYFFTENGKCFIAAYLSYCPIKEDLFSCSEWLISLVSSWLHFTELRYTDYSYHIYPKYWDTLTPYHTSPKIWTSILIPINVFEKVLDEWQTV